MCMLLLLPMLHVDIAAAAVQFGHNPVGCQLKSQHTVRTQRQGVSRSQTSYVPCPAVTCEAAQQAGMTTHQTLRPCIKLLLKQPCTMLMATRRHTRTYKCITCACTQRHAQPTCVVVSCRRRLCGALVGCAHGHHGARTHGEAGCKEHKETAEG